MSHRVDDTEMRLIDEVRSFRQRVAERLQELEPLVREYNELKQVAAEIGVDGTVAEAATVGEDGSALGAAETGEERRGRSRRRTASPALGERVLEAVRADPGKTVADYAAILGEPATSLYRPVRELTTDGALLKRARHLFPA